MSEPWTYLFRSDRWAACDKPAGWLSVPSRMGRADPRPVLGLALEQALSRRVWPVHRLDLEVSGVMLYALDAEAHRAASRWFETHAVRKTYEAWTSAATPPPPGEQEWRCRLARGKKRAFEAPHGKDSITLARALDVVTRDGLTLQRWQLQPLTGRSHQLRYEMARHGYPIVGDTLYGSDLPFLPEAIALRAVRLDLTACEGRAALGLPELLEAAPLTVTSESR